MKISARQWITGVLLVVLLTVAGFNILKKHVRKSSTGEKVISSDVMVFVNAGKSLLHGENIYYDAQGNKNSYVYLPFYAFVNIPLSFLDPQIVDIIWYILNIVFLIYILRYAYFILTGRHSKSLSYKEKWFYYGLAILFSSRFLVRNFQDANVNILILFLIVLSFYLYMNNKHDYYFLLIGITAAIKIFPLLFIIYFFAKKEIKPIIYILLGFIVATLSPLLILGLPKYIAYLIEFKEYTGRIMSAKGAVIENFSIWGTMVRTLTFNKSFVYQDQPVYLNLTNLSMALIKVFVFVINIFFVIYIYLFTKKESQTASVSKINLHNGAFVLTLLLMNFVSVLIEEHHVVSFLVVYLYFLIAVKEKLITGSIVKWIIYATGILSIITTHDILVPMAGKLFLLKCLAFSIPILPNGIVFILLLHYLNRKLALNNL
ncbi:DUF2029 domain-containing protein [candidate division KSB1 bacterium]|nr:DUF2029 domain-containing protein [candidate division KSB1 bacterium]